MCHYCGCRQIPLIIDFIAEHDAATSLAAAAIASIDAGDLEGARGLLDKLAGDLRAHWAGEEHGLFEVMGQSDEYADYIAALVKEHRELEMLLDAVDLTREGDRAALRAAIDELAPHIRKEEDGLFPAALISMGGDDWNRSMAAWHEAHPHSQLKTRGS